MNLDDYAGTRTIVTRYTRTTSELRSALSNVKGEAFDQVRRVELYHDGNVHDVDVRGPKDGRPLLINWRFGFVHLHVRSGNVVIVADSATGNPITVDSGANVTVITHTDRKVSTTVNAGAHVHFIAADGTRGYQSIAAGAHFHTEGDTSSMTIRHQTKAA